ncbi:hypothetical protein [Jiella marina]|uniref:hypothetical protein n=1 Tax=Jiella sp. LLJ827 TaxID=2917712 RepID=UPI0021017071|nr:hypothetical protein [Jiella sp. LLJ827]MCQ0986780.1 hypothetical protein [Jiella sp. LLJ827]
MLSAASERAPCLDRSFPQVPEIAVLCACRNRTDLHRYENYAGILGWKIEATTEIAKVRQLAETIRFDAVVVAGLVEDQAGCDVIADIRSGSGPNRDAPVMLVLDHLSERETSWGSDVRVDWMEFEDVLLSTFRIKLLKLAESAARLAEKR